MDAEIDWWGKADLITLAIEQKILSWAITPKSLTVAIEQPYVNLVGPGNAFKQGVFIGGLVQMLRRNPRVQQIAMVNPKTAKLALGSDGDSAKEWMVAKAAEFYPTIGTFALKSVREAIADAVGIGFAVYKFDNGQIDKGVEYIQ